MTASVLPPSPTAFAKATWDDVAPYFDDLVERRLDASTVDGWLHAWSRLEELVTEAAALAMIAYTIDTSDPEKEKDHLRFSTEILPRMEERSVELARRFVALGYSTPDLATTLERFRTSIDIFREENVPLFSELEELSARYQRITGSMTVEWEGVERPLPQLQIRCRRPLELTELGLRQCEKALVVLPQGFRGQGREGVSQRHLGPLQQCGLFGGRSLLGLELGDQPRALLPERGDPGARDEPAGESADDGADGQPEQQEGEVHESSGDRKANRNGSGSGQRRGSG